MNWLARILFDRGLLLALWLFMTANGCIIIPTPSHGGDGVITEDVVESLKPKENTRADVLHLLGDPIERLGEDRFFVYRWERTTAYWIHLWPGGHDFALKDSHYLLLEFTPDNRLRRLKFIVGRRMLDRDLDRWTKD